MKIAGTAKKVDYEVQTIINAEALRERANNVRNGLKASFLIPIRQISDECVGLAESAVKDILAVAQQQAVLGVTSFHYDVGFCFGADSKKNPEELNGMIFHMWKLLDTLGIDAYVHKPVVFNPHVLTVRFTVDYSKVDVKTNAINAQTLTLSAANARKNLEVEFILPFKAISEDCQQLVKSVVEGIIAEAQKQAEQGVVSFFYECGLYFATDSRKSPEELSTIMFYTWLILTSLGIETFIHKPTVFSSEVLNMKITVDYSK